MSDALSGALSGAGTEQQQDQQQQQQQQQASAFPAWLGEIPAELQTDDMKARATRFAQPVDMFKALTETQDWARGRVALPKEGDATSFAEFAAKVRPETADAYKIEVNDGSGTELADAFRPVAFDAGLHPEQVNKVVGFWNQTQADMVSKQTQLGNTELKSIEMEIGEAAYAQRVEAVSNLLRNAGVEVDDIAPAMEKIGGGAGKAMKALFTLAEATGELGKVDGVTVSMRLGSMNAKTAQETLTNLDKDPAFFKAAQIKNSPEWKKRDDLIRIIAGGQ
jgi:hypothetical protein